VLQPSWYLHPIKRSPKSGKAIYALRLNGLNTPFRHVVNNLRNKRVGLERHRHECIDPIEQCYYCGKDERELI